MPYRRRRIKRETMGKEAIKHTHTLIGIIGNGSNVVNDTIIETNAGDRSSDGLVYSIQNSANTGRQVMVGDIVKYLRIVLQAAVTAEGKDAQSETQGWVEWAVVFRNETTVPIPSTNIGTQTIGDIATTMFRGDCLMTGQFPVSVNLPNVETIQIKLPKKAIKFKTGSEIILYSLFRDSDITNLETDTVKLVKSFAFKAYN